MVDRFKSEMSAILCLNVVEVGRWYDGKCEKPFER